MRRAAWGWVVVFLVLQLLLQGCRLRGETSNGPAATPDALAGTSQATAIAPATAGDVPGATRSTVQKPPKPASEETGAGAVERVQPTPDPELDAWTILVYMSASAELDDAALRALNAMEAAGSSQDVNVFVQLDRNPDEVPAGEWRGARRYRITADEDVSAVTSTLVGELGATNMGDPDSLTAFIAWGQQEHPANHYALVLWGESRSWRGVVHDTGEDDDLSMSDLSGALERALPQSQRTILDIIAFDAGMTANLEVLNAIQPYANFAVAAQGLLSPAQRSYDLLLGALYDDESVTPQQLAQLIATTGPTKAGSGNALPATMAAFDLRALPAANEALQHLAQYLVQNGELSWTTVAAARRAALITIPHTGPGGNLFATVDLRRFAEQIMLLAPRPVLSQHGDAISTALEKVILTNQASGAGRSSSGITLAFLPLEGVGDPLYADVDPGGWQAALHSFYEASGELRNAPQGEVEVQGSEGAGAHSPVLLGWELRTTDLDDAAFVALREEAEGGRRLLYLNSIGADMSLAGPNAGWRAGVWQQEMIWDTTAPYLSDGANGDFVPLWPAPGDLEPLVVPVRFVPAADGVTARDAVLLFDSTTQTLDSVWEMAKRDGALRQVLPAAGDGFQLYNVFLESDDRLTYEPGVTLIYSDGVDIAYDYFPLPSGDYQVGLLADGTAASSLVAPVDVTVANEELLPGYQAYLNGDHGFQFLYPLTWPEPVFDGRRVATAARQRGPELTVSTYPQFGGASAAQLKTQTLEAFGELDILYEEAVSVHGEEGQLVAYGYSAEDGPHTGVFVAFVDTDRDTGYVIDLDGLALDEAMTIEIANRIVASWRFAPVDAGSWPEQWATTTRSSLTVTLPPTYRHETLDNGWELFKDGPAFLAVRGDAISGEGGDSIAQHWTAVAARGVDAFDSEDPRPLALGRSLWSRVDFTYEGDDGPVSGVVLATVYGGQEVVAWAEAPAGSFQQLWNDHFLVSLAGVLPNAPGSAGLLYEATFDEPGSWGTGRQEGATGAVTDGVYELGIEASRGFFWTAAGASLADGYFEVDVMQTAGSSDSAFGLLLRAEHEVESFYVFEISADGYVWIGWCRRNCAEATSLVEDGWFASEAINQGLSARNTLLVTADGPHLTFFINGSEVGKVDDERATAGDVGLFGETFGDGGLVVQFDDLRVLAP